MLDLVLNHVAREHEWAGRARAGEAHYRDYFHVYPDRDLPDAYERTLPEVFPDFAPGNFTWDDELDGWVWTTFNEWQWDLNWANPDVLVEYADIVLFLANLGVEVLRLDAIAFMWKRLGTNCQNQPEVHAVTQALRAVARIAARRWRSRPRRSSDRATSCSTSAGRHAGRVSDLAYHNSLMVQVWSMLATGSTTRPAGPRGAPDDARSGTWICYVRCHDDIGWAIDDGDAAPAGSTACAPPVPVELVLRRPTRVLGARSRLPAQRCDRRQADQRHGGIADGAGRCAGTRRGGRAGPPLPGPRGRRRLGRCPRRVERRRARPAERPDWARDRVTRTTTGGRTGSGWTGRARGAATSTPSPGRSSRACAIWRACARGCRSCTPPRRRG